MYTILESHPEHLPAQTLENKLHQADDNPYLNYDALVEACDKIFGNRKAIPYEEFKQRTKEAYTIHMEEYAKLHNFTDAVKLAEYCTYIINQIDKAVFKKLTNKHNIIVVGCGQGRLAEVYIALAKKLGIEKITFNDLIEIHVEQTREKIRQVYHTDGTTADGIKISYLPGDFLTVDISEYFDAAFLIWYVSAEFCDPSSAENMRAMRLQMYSKLNRILIPGGGFIEDIPDPNMAPGFYEIGNQKTEHILKDRGILEGEQHNLLLSNWTPEQQDGFPYQLRYTPRNGTDYREKEKTGFILRKTESLSVPISSLGTDATYVLEAIKKIPSVWEAIRVLNKVLMETVKFPDGDQIDQKRRKMTWWEKST